MTPWSAAAISWFESIGVDPIVGSACGFVERDGRPERPRSAGIWWIAEPEGEVGFLLLPESSCDAVVMAAATHTVDSDGQLQRRTDLPAALHGVGIGVLPACAWAVHVAEELRQRSSERTVAIFTRDRPRFDELQRITRELEPVPPLLFASPERTSFVSAPAEARAEQLGEGLISALLANSHEKLERINQPLDQKGADR